MDSKTLVVGEGLGTITKQFKDQGKMPTITDLLGVNDQVVVYFKDAAGAKRATEIRVLVRREVARPREAIPARALRCRAR